MARKGSAKKGQPRRDIYLDQLPNEDLQSYARRLAKASDQRLVRLEGASYEKHYSGVLEWAYKGASHDIKSLYGDTGNRPRFNRGIPKKGEELTKEQTFELRKKIEAMKKFIERPTSSKTGIKEMYSQQAKRLNKDYGTNFNWLQMANFFESESFEKMKKEYGSKTMFKVIGKIQKSGKKTIEAITEANNKHKITSNKVEERTIKMMLKNTDIDLMDIFAK